jgi:hypothetical protein
VVGHPRQRVHLRARCLYAPLSTKPAAFWLGAICAKDALENYLETPQLFVIDDKGVLV